MKTFNDLKINNQLIVNTVDAENLKPVSYVSNNTKISTINAQSAYIPDFNQDSVYLNITGTDNITLTNLNYVYNILVIGTFTLTITLPNSSSAKLGDKYLVSIVFDTGSSVTPVFASNTNNSNDRIVYYNVASLVTSQSLGAISGLNSRLFSLMYVGKNYNGTNNVWLLSPTY